MAIWVKQHMHIAIPKKSSVLIMGDQGFCGWGEKGFPLVHAATATIAAISTNASLIKLCRAHGAVVFQLGHVLVVRDANDLFWLL